jgi:hypothetical protein
MNIIRLDLGCIRSNCPAPPVGARPALRLRLRRKHILASSARGGTRDRSRQPRKRAARHLAFNRLLTLLSLSLRLWAAMRRWVVPTPKPTRLSESTCLDAGLFVPGQCLLGPKTRYMPKEV